MKDLPPLKLRAEGLLSKWGFRDGDALECYVMELERDFGPDTRIAAFEELINEEPWDWSGLEDFKMSPSLDHRVLERCVLDYVVPAIEALGHKLKILRCVTYLHNPIRATELDGQPVDWYTDDRDDWPEVSIPFQRLVDYVLEERERPKADCLA